MKAKTNVLLPLLLVFVICNGFFLLASSLLAKWHIDKDVLIIANSLFLILSLITIFIQKKALDNKNPNVFIRSVMAGMMIKMFVCMIGIFIYWLLMKDKFSKVTVVAGMFVYFIYLAVEVSLITKLNKQKNA